MVSINADDVYETISGRRSGSSVETDKMSNVVVPKSFPQQTNSGRKWLNKLVRRSSRVKHNSHDCHEDESSQTGPLSGCLTELEDSLRCGCAFTAASHAERLPGGRLKIVTQCESLLTPFVDTRLVAHDDDNEPRRKVIWGTLELNIHPIVLGDNPSVTSGPPLAMGGGKDSAIARLSFDVVEYDNHRPAARTKDQLLVPRALREDWLRDEGYSRSELHSVEAELKRIRKSRARQSGPFKLFSKSIRTAVLR